MDNTHSDTGTKVGDEEWSWPRRLAVNRINGDKRFTHNVLMVEIEGEGFGENEKGMLLLTWFPLSFFFLKIYLFIHERHRERGRGRSRFHAGSPMWDLILGPGITPRAEGGAKPLSHPGCPLFVVLCFCFIHFESLLWIYKHLGFLSLLNWPFYCYEILFIAVNILRSEI